MKEQIRQDIPIGQEKVDKWHSLDYHYQPSDLEDVPLKYRGEDCKNRDMKLRQEALKAFVSMIESAEADGVIIRCISAFRPASYQDTLYKKAVEKEGEGQKSTAKPGHSEHQLGTVVDVSSPEIDFGLKDSFADTESYRWILANAYHYSFYVSYTKENHHEKGYIWEPWHLRYWGNNVSDVVQDDI